MDKIVQQVKRGATSAWTAADNATSGFRLADGEIGYDKTTGILFIGDGSSKSSLLRKFVSCDASKNLTINTVNANSFRAVGSTYSSVFGATRELPFLEMKTLLNSVTVGRILLSLGAGNKPFLTLSDKLIVDNGFEKSGVTGTYLYNGRNSAFIHLPAPAGTANYAPSISMSTPNADWSVGVVGEELRIIYTDNTEFDGLIDPAIQVKMSNSELTLPMSIQTLNKITAKTALISSDEDQDPLEIKSSLATKQEAGISYNYNDVNKWVAGLGIDGVGPDKFGWWYDNDSKMAMTLNGNGSLEIKGQDLDYLPSAGNFGLKLNNSDIIGVNNLVFNDESDSGEGIMFPHSGKGGSKNLSDYDEIRALDGRLYINGTKLVTSTGGASHMVGNQVFRYQQGGAAVVNGTGYGGGLCNFIVSVVDRSNYSSVLVLAGNCHPGASGWTMYKVLASSGMSVQAVNNQGTIAVAGNGGPYMFQAWLTVW